MTTHFTPRSVWIEQQTGERMLQFTGILGKGGEGVVYSTNEPQLVVKLRHADRPLSTKDTRKIHAMVGSQPTRLPSGVAIAWPNGVIRDSRQGNIIGYSMPRVQNSPSLYGVFHIRERLTSAPWVDWHFQHEVARNLAKAISCAHSYGAVVGDLNCRNVLVRRDRSVVVIDVDSWQVADPQRKGCFFECEVAMPDYTSPEMTGKPSKNCIRNYDQDCFALAVLIFQLLYFYHPFQGIWLGNGEPPSLSESIRSGHSVFSASRLVKPPPVGVPLAVLDGSLQSLFRRTFVEGHASPGKRVSADEWASSLEVATELLESCSNVPNHFVTNNSSGCFWCDAKSRGVVDYFPMSTTAKRIHSLPDRLLSALSKGDDEQVCTWVTRHPWLLSHGKCRHQINEIRRSQQRFDLFREWVALQERQPNDPWALIDRWPKELDGSWLSSQGKLNGRPASIIVQELEQARRLVQRVAVGLESWSQIADIEQKASLFPSSLINEFSKFTSKLPSVYPEQKRLTAMVDTASRWGKAWFDLAEELQKVEQLHEDGEDDLAVELLDLLQERWPSYARLGQVRSSLCSGRLPWDTLELRAEIRSLVAAGKFRGARTKLALLPAAAMPQLRTKVRVAIQQAELSVKEAIAANSRGDSFVAVHRFVDAQRLCNDLPYIVMGRFQVESAESKRQAEFARVASSRKTSTTLPQPPSASTGGVRTKPTKGSGLSPVALRKLPLVDSLPKLRPTSVWQHCKLLILIAVIAVAFAAICGLTWLLWT